MGYSMIWKLQEDNHYYMEDIINFEPFILIELQLQII